MLTPKKELFSRAEELVLSLRVGDGVESPDANNSPNHLARSVISVRIRPQHAAHICFEPELICSLALLATLVDTVAFHRAGKGGMDAHIDSGEGIVATKEGSASRLLQ